jgi:amino acid transporter
LGSRQLGLSALVVVMYLTICGGAYGLEDTVRLAGARLSLILCILVPLSLSLPTALMAAELTALMPVEGGFYFWVKQAFGPFAGFAEAYLTILYTAVDMAIYPVMFSAYLSFVVPMTLQVRIVLGIVMVWMSGLLNVLGIRPVGVASIILTIVLTLPFVALVAIGFPRLMHWHLAPMPANGDFIAALGGGLTVVIWNFSGWENLSVVAREIRDPRRNYLRAVAIVLPLVTLGYVLPLAVTLSGASTATNWTTGSFSEMGRVIGGSYLGYALAIGGMISSFAVFEAGMLWVSRLPFVLARERYLPAPLADVWERGATPWKAIVLCCVMFTLLVPLGFTALIVLDVFFYMTALALEMGALLKLRRLYPVRDGLFKIAGGRNAIYVIAIAPLLTWMATFGLVLGQGDSRIDFVTAVALAMTTWPAYWLCRRIWGGPSLAYENAVL